jgi:hypothetical protein
VSLTTAHENREAIFSRVSVWLIKGHTKASRSAATTHLLLVKVPRRLYLDR